MSSHPAILAYVHSAVLSSYAEWALQLARSSAAVANFCDHVEHNEQADRAWVLDAARDMRALACTIARAEDIDLRAAYAARLTAIEARNPLRHPGSLDGGARAEQATTWRDLQLVQAEHDRYYHADVVGLSKLDQLRHYALHLIKLVGALAQAAEDPEAAADFRDRRLADLLLFGVKLSTVTGHSLPETALVARADQRRLVAA
jgi:hypothetical protein